MVAWQDHRQPWPWVLVWWVDLDSCLHLFVIIIVLLGSTGGGSSGGGRVRCFASQGRARDAGRGGEVGAGGGARLAV